MTLAFTFTEVARDHMRRRGYTEADMLGDIPAWLSLADERGAIEQIHAMYEPIGGGWRDFAGFRLGNDCTKLIYPGDPPLPLIAEARLRDERILFFDSSWVVVLQPDGAFRAARID